MKKMQDIAEGIKHFWDNLSIPLQAAIFSGLLTVLRLAYDSRDGRKLYRKLLEGGICVGVTFGLSSGLSAFGLPVSGAWLVAVGMGWYGADYVRERGRLWAENKVKGNNDTPTN